MAAYSTEQAIDMLINSSFEELDSGGEGDIEEDPAFPLPHSEESEDSGNEGMINYFCPVAVTRLLNNKI